MRCLRAVQISKKKYPRAYFIKKPKLKPPKRICKTQIRCRAIPEPLYCWWYSNCLCGYEGVWKWSGYDCLVFLMATLNVSKKLWQLSDLRLNSRSLQKLFLQVVWVLHHSVLTFKLISNSAAGHVRHSKDVFVFLAHTELSDLFVGWFGTIKGVRLHDIDTCTINRTIHVYKVLTHDRNRLFCQLRREAKHLRIQSI